MPWWDDGVMTSVPEDSRVWPAVTYDGQPVAEDDPRATTVVVRRPGTTGWEYLVLHRAHEGPDYAGDWAWTAPAGARLPGEPMEPAALRELAEESGIVDVAIWAVDLSSECAVFAAEVEPDQEVVLDAEHDRYEWLPVDEAVARMLPASVAEQVRGVDLVPSVRFRFRPMTLDDLPAVAERLSQPHVRPWFDPQTHTLEQLQQRYGDRIRGESATTRMWVVEVDGSPVGQVQDYRVGDEPDFAEIDLPDAVGIDYALTDPGLIGHGLGTRMLWRFLRDVIWVDYDATQVVAAPAVGNVASLRTLEKVGFVADRQLEGPGSTRHVLSVLDLTRLFG